MKKTLLCLLLSTAPGLSYAAWTGNIATSNGSGSQCGIGNIGNLPTLSTTYSSGGNTYLFLTSTYLLIGSTSVTYGNVLISFNTTDKKYSVQFPQGSSAPIQFTGNYTGAAGKDSYVTQHFAANLDCGLTVTGETVLVGN